MKITSFVAITSALLLATTTAHADRRAFSGTGNYSSNGKFGLGVELGEPTGLNGKLFLGPSTALDFGIGELYHNFYVNSDGFHLYGDILFHPVELTHTADFKLPFYIGVGGRIWFFNCGGACVNNSAASMYGIRVPLGIDFDLNRLPLDFFIEAVPTFDFYQNYKPHNFYLDVDFSVGACFWFG